jgi:hypothetical protein
VLAADHDRQRSCRLLGQPNPPRRFPGLTHGRQPNAELNVALDYPPHGSCVRSADGNAHPFEHTEPDPCTHLHPVPDAIPFCYSHLDKHARSPRAHDHADQDHHAHTIPNPDPDPDL